MRFLSLTLISALLLTGCAAEDIEQPGNEDSAVETEQPNQQDSAEAESLAPDGLPDIDPSIYVPIESLEEAAVIAANSFDKFLEGGIVETVAEGNLVLVHNPDQKDQYRAALIDTVDDTADLIFDTNDFTSAWPFLLLSEPEKIANTYFGSHPAGFTLEYDDPSFGRYGFNYLTDGELLLGAWWYPEPENPEIPAVVTYNYEVEQKWIDRLDVAVDDFLSEDSTE